jgi:type II secretory pathway pseudopilin PulG
MSNGKKMRSALTVIELLVVLSVIAVLFSLLLPAVQQIRASAARTACANNLKQVGLALIQHHDEWGVLPAGCSVQSGQAPQLHLAWCARLLPYLEQAQL